ncbi:beta-lactamase family protein [Hymenobacter busanensis]|uniref:Beta-lactamase family protein n=1 Tax=Hymenobacter busanensis TaxID=2607656 RepID=A0A7L4ZZ46_9BACT|nr:serine hydrolase domain-containing protein [Hymenobacter busanensis]KAA9332999.1 beta-lactamase family protein [Hymenobacter busanensis]QHJ08327.1 serine hydrolase [Hymenobacter busanensis]
MKKLLVLLWGLLAVPALAQTGIPVPQLAACDALVGKFMQRWKVPGASVAISRHGKLVYARGFGYADLTRTEPMQPAHQLRVASVSKPVTAVAIMKLVEDGRLSLDHKVFGPEGYLQNAYYTDAVTDARIYDITVQQLLEHAAGWNRNAGVDGFPGSDPIEFPLHVAETLHAPNPVGDSTLVRFLLAKGLDFDPGSRFAYSNIGYLILGKVLESVTHQPYEQWVQQHVLAPSGVHEAHLGRNLLANKLPFEAEYFSNEHDASCYGTGKQVAMPYGGRNLEAMNAHGGWVFSARDLVRLLLAIDGSPSHPDLLTPASVATMLQPSDNNRRYAKGWMVNKGRVRWHTGSLDGTASCVATNNEGYTWAILLNGCPAPNRFWNDLEELGWDCIKSTNDWPTLDLLPPDRQPAQLRAQPTLNGTARLTWTPGNGTHNLVVVHEGSPAQARPLDGQLYAASSTFGYGAALGHGSFVVEAGPDSTVIVGHLTPGKTYYAQVLAYNQSEATNHLPVYALEGSPSVAFRLPVAPAVIAQKAKPATQATSRKASARAKARRPAQQPTAEKPARTLPGYLGWLFGLGRAQP